ncbi:MAG: PadR family transcriptional regulator [Thermoplasmata archaeon]
MTSFNRIKIIFILSKGDRNSYQLSKMLSAQDRRMSSGTLFPILRDLENEGFVVVNRNNGRKFYSLTEKGKNYVAALENLRDNLRKKLMEAYLRDHILIYERDDYSLLLSKDFVNHISELSDIIGNELTGLLSLLITLISKGDRDAVLRIREKIIDMMEEEHGIYNQS